MSITCAGRRAILPAQVRPSLVQSDPGVKSSDTSKPAILGTATEVRPLAGTGHSAPASTIPILAKGIGIGVGITLAFVINGFAGFCFLSAACAWVIGQLEHERLAVYEAPSD